MQDNIIERKEVKSKLFKLLRTHKIVYIGTHIGWGKTSFVLKSLNDNEVSYNYYSCKDNILNQKFNSKVVVIDDLFLIEDEQTKNLLFTKIVDSKSKFIILSRTSVPLWLKPFELTKQLVTIDAFEFSFSIDEIKELLTLNGVQFDEEEPQQILDATKGWPLSISFVVSEMKKEKFSEDLMNRVIEKLYDYFDYFLFQRWSSDIQELLLSIATLKSFDIEAAKMATGRNDVKDIIDRMMNISSFTTFTPPDNYEIINLFSKYLVKKQNELCSKERRNLIYQNIALYYELKDDIANAIEYYQMAENFDKVSSILIANTNKNATNSRYYEISKYYFLLPENLVLKSPELISAMSMIYSLKMDFEKSEYWFEKLKDLKNSIDKNDSRYKIAKEKLAYLDLSLPHRGSKNIAKIVLDIATLSSSENISFQDISVSGNMPSLMNGGKDFCEWTKAAKKYEKLLKKPFEICLGKQGTGLANCGLGESSFEKCVDLNFTETMSYLNAAQSEVNVNGTLQMKFAVNSCISRVFIAMGSIETAVSIAENFRKKVLETSEYELLENVDALIVRLKMLLGKNHDVNLWFEEKAPNEFNDFFVTKRYCYMTKVRCYILNKKYYEAISLINLMKNYAKLYDRKYVYMICSIFYSVVLYQMNDSNWEEEFDKAIKLCEEYKFTRIVANEGVLVLELLNKHKYSGDKTYYKTLQKLTRNQAILYPKYLVPSVSLTASLSDAEKNVLSLVVQGKTNNEISEFLGITLSTVKFHISNIFGKLQVENRSQAIKVSNDKKHIIS